MTSDIRRATAAPKKAPTDKLANPSVIEAVCELRFASGASYTVVPGAMMERLRSHFPEHEILPTASIMPGLSDHVMLPPVPHHRFKSRKPNALVQTGPRLLTVNILPIYPSFEAFRELILKVLEHYQAVAKPGNPTRIGLRYINHIVSQTISHGLTEYFNYRLDYPETLPHPSSETSVRLVFSYGDLGILAVAVAFPAQTAQGEVGALLDLDFSITDPKDFDLTKFPRWLDEAHGIIYQAFMSTLTEKVINRMRGEKHE
jgi:uncharacterized protein (TIGR04255 family)